MEISRQEVQHEQNDNICETDVQASTINEKEKDEGEFLEGQNFLPEIPQNQVFSL